MCGQCQRQVRRHSPSLHATRGTDDRSYAKFLLTTALWAFHLRVTHRFARSCPALMRTSSPILPHTAVTITLPISSTTLTAESWC